jgi:hypothetical protein
MIKDLDVLSQAGLFMSCVNVPNNFHTEEMQNEICSVAKRLGVSPEVVVVDRASKMDVMTNFLKSRQVLHRVAPGDVLIIATNDPMSDGYDPVATTRFVAEIKNMLSSVLRREPAEIDD